MPDVKIVWWNRSRFTELGLVEKLFERVREPLEAHGYVARQGPRIDATFVEVPKQRNNREENAQIKVGEVPAGWKSAKARQKDVDARWAEKNEETHYGYKNHINADEIHKLIQEYVVTNAAVHESQVFDLLLDDASQADGTLVYNLKRLVQLLKRDAKPGVIPLAANWRA